MRRWILCAGFVGAVALAVPGWSHSADGKSAKSDKSDPPKERLIPAGQALGEIVKVEEGNKSFTLRLHAKQPEIKWNNNMPRPGNPGSYRPPSLSFKDAYADLEVSIAEDAKIRVPFRPEFDEQTKKLKPESVRSDPKDPDRKLGGIKGTEKDLRNKQWAVVTLATTREKPPQLKATAIVVVSEAPEK